MTRKAAKRELIEPHAKDKRYVRRTRAVTFTTSQDDVSESLSQDRRRKQKPSQKNGKAIEATRNLERLRARTHSIHVGCLQRRQPWILLPGVIERKIMITKVGLAIGLAVSLSLASLVVFANERPGPKGSVGGGTPSAGKGVPQMQAPVDPMQQGGDVKSAPQPGSGQGTQNPKEGNDTKGGSPTPDKGKEKK